jgi:hypothetical protein
MLINKCFGFNNVDATTPSMPRLRRNDREQAVGMVQAGMTHQAVADHFNVSRITISMLMIRLRQKTGNDRPRNGTMVVSVCYGIQCSLNNFELSATIMTNSSPDHNTSHMVLSIIFLDDKHKIVLHLSIFYEYQQFFQHRICFSIQPITFYVCLQEI